MENEAVEALLVVAVRHNGCRAHVNVSKRWPVVLILCACGGSSVQLSANTTPLQLDPWQQL